MDAFDRAKARRDRELRTQREQCRHTIGARTCGPCRVTYCAVCQPAHTCKERTS